MYVHELQPLCTPLCKTSSIKCHLKSRYYILEYGEDPVNKNKFASTLRHNSNFGCMYSNLFVLNLFGKMAILLLSIWLEKGVLRKYF